MQLASQPQTEARLHFLDYWRVVKNRKAIVFVVWLLVTLVTTTVTFFQPKTYMASARIKVEHDKPNIAVYEQTAMPAYDPYFLQTQYEIIQSQKILYPVIEQAKLQKRWGQGGQDLPLEFAFRKLKSMMSVRRFRDTSLIEIGVQDEDPHVCAELANLIADVFARERLDAKRQLVLQGIRKLREEVLDQQKRVEDAQRDVEQLRRDLNVPVFGAVKLNDQTIVQLEQQLTSSKVEQVSRESRLRELQKLSPLQLRNAIATVFSEPNVQALLQNLTDSELRLVVLKQDFGLEHPQVKAAVAQRDKINEQLDARLEGIMRGFEIEYKMSEQRTNELQKQLDGLKKSSLALDSEAFLPYRNAVRKQDSEERFYEALKQRLHQATTDIEMPRSPVEVTDAAVPVNVPVSPNMKLNIGLGAALGLLLGVALAFFIEFLDTSVKIMEDVERFLGLPVVGVVPQGTVLLSKEEASPAHLEAYRMLRTNIDFGQPETDHKSIAVLSAGAGEGKSFTLANLAYVYAQQGQRVLVVDSDLRRPTTHKYFGIGRDIGLSDFLSGAKSVDEVIHPTNVANIWMIPTGGVQSSRLALPLLTSNRMNQLIREVGQRFDVVLYDTPPVLGISDATVVAREVGKAILVVQHRRFPRAMSQRARKMVENAGGKLLGVVVNNVHVGHEDTYYYYHEHYEHYSHLNEETRPKPARKQTAAVSEQIQLQDKY